MKRVAKEIRARRFASKPLVSGGQILNSRLRHVYEVWRTKSGKAKAPRYDSIDLIEISEVATSIILLDVLGTTEFRFRLVGTEGVERFGIDATDMLLSELPPGEFVDSATALMEAVTLEGQPYWHEPKSSVFPNKGHVTYEYVVLPLLDENGAVAHIMTVVDFLEQPAP